jgi:predicted molibdopterin-dependent oxidoreductase YjgC
MTRRSDGLVARSPELEIAINPQDGERYSVADGERVRLESRRGELEGRAVHTDRMRPGEVFVPFVKLEDQAANFLTNAVYDPASGIPEYKVCAIRIERAGKGKSSRRS